MTQSFNVSWWEDTGKLSEFEDGIASPLYRNIESDDEVKIRDLPVGACYQSKFGTKGFDGQSIVCVVPYSKEGRSNKTYHWSIDSNANNCTKPDDDTHRCWVRHGGFGDFSITVDKQGNTCQAGAGSIVVPGWHGFLKNGKLIPC